MSLVRVWNGQVWSGEMKCRLDRSNARARTDDIQMGAAERNAGNSVRS
jgi:hypothetical protein